MREIEITEVIERKSHFKTIHTHLASIKISAGIVHQHIQALILLLELLANARCFAGYHHKFVVHII